MQRTGLLSRVWKEARTISYPWAIMAAVCLMPFFWRTHPSDAAWVWVFAMSLGAVFMGAASFGSEFSDGTITLLLSQPISRSRLWFEKMFVLTIALVPFFLLLPRTSAVLQNGPHAWLVVYLPLMGLLSAPYLALLTRNRIGTIVFSVLIPALGWIGISACGYLLHEAGGFQPETFDIAYRTVGQLGFAAMASYTVGCALAGLWRFQRLELAGQPADQVMLGDSLERVIGRICSLIFPSRSSLTAVLIHKELRLQQTICFLAVLFCVIQAAVLALILWVPLNNRELYFYFPIVILTALTPILIGAHCIAEERNLQTHLWHLTVPASACRQWLTKLATVFPLSALIGVILPAAWLQIGHFFTSAIPGFGPVSLEGSLSIFAIQFFLTTLAVYSSSASSNTLQAAILATGLSMLFAAGFLFSNELRHGLNMGSWSEPKHPVLLMYGSIAMLLISVFLTLFAYENFRWSAIDRRRVGRQMLIIVAPAVLLLLPVWLFLAA